MNLKIKQECIQSKKPVVFPQLKQALDILRMSTNELFGYVEKQLEINPVLDIAEYKKPFITSEGYDLEVEPEDEHVYEMHPKSMDDNSFDTVSDTISDYRLEYVASGISLKDYLLLQLYSSGLDRFQMKIGEYLISNVDENGYLTCSLSEAAAYFNVPISKIKNVLLHIQSFDPPGICARNLKECLLIQLRQMNITDKNVYRVVKGFLDDLALKRVSEVARNTNLSKNEIINILRLIKTLEPKPGRNFYNNSCSKYLLPDIFIRKIRNAFEAVLNEEAIPVVNIDKYYKQLGSQETSPETKKFIQRRINNAVWLIKCIEQRKMLLKRLGEYIAAVQKDFFENGQAFKRAVSIKQAASELGVDKELVSIAAEGKYVNCKWGDFEMKYFFRL
ncbi:MAG TPA: RNA polymerase factor sigma-54 [Clostridiaceae bacterium]|nr:RNA polymerase factor sigma-54 [Clostridiaceae bacterium]